VTYCIANIVGGGSQTTSIIFADAVLAYRGSLICGERYEAVVINPKACWSSGVIP